MSLKDLFKKGILKKHSSSIDEISTLLESVERDLADAAGNISPDWKFGIAYNASLTLCTLLIHAEGYRVGKGSHHMNTFSTLSKIMGSDRISDQNYLDSCRKKRNMATYDRAGVVSEDEAEELIAFANEFKIEVMSWLIKNHPEYLNK